MRKFSHTVFLDSAATRIWLPRIWQGSDPGGRKRLPTPMEAVRTAGAVVAALALAAGTARASVAATAANGAGAFVET
jgi:hypothetical protein